MPHPDLAPLAQRMEARFDELVERLTDELPNVSAFYAALPPEVRRTASVNLYNLLRDSVEEGGVERFAQAIGQIGRNRIAQGGTPSDLRAATDLIRQLNLSLLDDLVHGQPGAAVPAFAWLDRLASASLDIFNRLEQESLARQAEELNALVTLSERIEQARRADEAIAAVFEQLPRLGVDRAVMSARSAEDPHSHRIIGVFAAGQPPSAASDARFAVAGVLKHIPLGTAFVQVAAADVELPEALAALLNAQDVQTLAFFPFWAGDELRDMAILGYRQPRQLSVDEQRTITLLGRMLRNRIAGLRLVERLQEQLQRAAVLTSLIEGAGDAIFTSDAAGTITYANPAAAQLLGLERPDELIGVPFLRFLDARDNVRLRDNVLPQLLARKHWKGAFTLVTAQGEEAPVTSSAIPLLDADRALTGVGWINRDERERLTLIESLQNSNAEQQHTLELLRQLSTPLVPVMDGILVMPIVGDLDSRRAGQILETLLEGVTRSAADTVILDITGVPLVDTGVANALIQAARAVRLLGAEALLVGITPEVAQTVVGLGVDLGALVTRGDLRSGIAYALARRGYRITPTAGAQV
jgi:rsbT co-antagonist protein RsbR